MKKLFASFVLFLWLISANSQNSYNLLVQANYIRIWSKPISTELIPNVYLKFGERIRIIDVIIES
ncbi:MAG TPA: hypothetical protein VKR58_15080, partial [Aquella sp.]|nr:hypothetical protein [Aquella sp.]